jgi:hypothetical protein
MSVTKGHSSHDWLLNLKLSNNAQLDINNLTCSLLFLFTCINAWAELQLKTKCKETMFKYIQLDR